MIAMSGEKLGAARERRGHVGLAQEDQPVVAEDFLDLGDLRLVRADQEHPATDDPTVLERRGLVHVRRGAAAADLEREPFPSREHVQRLASAAHVGASHRLHPLHHRVVVRRIVVEEHQALDAGGQRDVDRVLDAAVAPADLVAVLRVGVLGVVDDEVRALQERDVALVTRMLRDAPRGVPERLVVGRVGDGRAVAGHAVGDRGRGVVQELRLDQHAADAEEPLVELREVDARAQVAHLDREVRVLHLAGHRLLEPALETDRRVDVQLGARQERGDEERKALDVIPVGVADEEVEPKGLGHRLDQMQAELAGAGAAIEDDHGAVGGPYLDARGVSPEARGVRPRRGDRSTRSPEANLHGG